LTETTRDDKYLTKVSMLLLRGPCQKTGSRPQSFWWSYSGRRHWEARCGNFMRFSGVCVGQARTRTHWWITQIKTSWITKELVNRKKRKDWRKTHL